MFVRDFLPLSQFDRLQDFVHRIQCLAQRLDDLVDLLDRLLHSHRGGRAARWQLGRWNIMHWRIGGLGGRHR